MFPLGPSLEVVFNVVAHGLGHIWVDARIAQLRSSAIFQALTTPLDPLHVEMRFSVALRIGPDASSAPARLLLSRLLTRALGPAFRNDIQQDFPVWEHKIYVEQPRLAKGDGPIPAFRRWARQFYSETATTNGHAPTPALNPGR